MIRACAAVGGCKTANTLSRRWISCCRWAVCELLMAMSIGDEAVDLAVAEQPLATLLHHLVGIAAARADLRSPGGVGRAVLHDRPVRAHRGGVAIQLNADVGDQMNRARPVFAGPGPNVTRQHSHPHTPGALRESGSPETYSRGQSGHA